MAERQGRRLRRRRIDVRRFCPDLIEAHFWLGRSRLRVTPGWRHLKSESTGDGRPMRTRFLPADIARVRPQIDATVWRQVLCSCRAGVTRGRCPPGQL